MRTVDIRAAPARGRLEVLRRDIRVLIRIGRLIFSYAVVGGRVRREYRAKEARGEVFWLDRELRR